MKKPTKHFTLIEIIITLVIVGILAAIAVPAYQNMIEDSKQKACKTNQAIILGAIEAYTFENDQMPASLSQLRDKDIRYAYDKIMKKTGWQVKLAYFFVDIEEQGLAYAQGWMNRTVGRSWQNIKCPCVTTPGTTSYGIYVPSAGSPLNRTAYNNWNTLGPGPMMPVVADCDNATFTDPMPPVVAARHARYDAIGLSKKHYALGLTPDGNETFCVEEDNYIHCQNYWY